MQLDRWLPVERLLETGLLLGLEQGWFSNGSSIWYRSSGMLPSRSALRFFSSR